MRSSNHHKLFSGPMTHSPRMTFGQSTTHSQQVSFRGASSISSMSHRPIFALTRKSNRAPTACAKAWIAFSAQFTVRKAANRSEQQDTYATFRLAGLRWLRQRCAGGGRRLRDPRELAGALTFANEAGPTAFANAAVEVSCDRSVGGDATNRDVDGWTEGTAWEQGWPDLPRWLVRDRERAGERFEGRLHIWRRLRRGGQGGWGRREASGDATEIARWARLVRVEENLAVAAITITTRVSDEV